ncbi:MAG: excinuclease ABC subunit UvrB [Patescibacteria group bacterium]
MPKFQLNAPYKPTGDQPKAIEQMLKNLDNNVKHQTLLGVTGSGKTFAVANVINAVQKPTLVLSHNKTLAAQLYSEFKEFFPNNAVSYFVSYYDYYQPEAYMPATDTYIEKDASINEEIDKFRHAATMNVLTRRDVIIVATVSCIYGLGDVDDYSALAIKIKKGESYQRDKLLRQLTEIQYTRSQMEFKQGMFHVLGDVVEIFPPGQDTIYRLEFFGDELEKISEEEEFTGEIVRELDEITIFPAKHSVTTREKIERAIDQIRVDLDVRYNELKKMGKGLEAERIKTRTEYDIELLLETGYVSGIENYTRYFSGKAPGEPPSTLMDYFPKDFLLVVDESHISIPQIGGMYNGNFSRKQTLVDFGFRLPSAHDNRPLKFDEFEEFMDRVVYISATPAKYELEKSKDTMVEMIVRPTGLIDPRVEVRPTKNQIPDIIGEVKKRIVSKERTLITTLTKRSSEDLTDFLVDAGLKVKYLHSDIETFERVEILRDLRLGAFDVLVGINLLREGLDLPEVSFIAILDADKQGFLRSTSALVQTIGRCARNVNGFVVMYADRITDGMKGALSETERRRKLQTEYNEKHGITPQTIIKAIKAIDAPGKKKDRAPKIDIKKVPKEEMGRLIKGLEVQMEMAAQNLDFELAAELRDQIEALKAKI